MKKKKPRTQSPISPTTSAGASFLAKMSANEKAALMSRLKQTAEKYAPLFNAIADALRAAENRALGLGSPEFRENLERLMQATHRPQQPAQPAGAEPVAAVTPKALLKEPPADAFKAYRACAVVGQKQRVVAKQLKTKQWKVSRWIKQVKEYLKAGNILPELPQPMAKPNSVDPAVIEMGERTDRRSRRQRPASTDEEEGG